MNELDRAVDRVDHPASLPPPGSAHLLAQYGIRRPFPAYQLPDGQLSAPVGFGDGAQVSFGLDGQRGASESGERQAVRQITGRQGQIEINDHGPPG